MMGKCPCVRLWSRRRYRRRGPFRRRLRGRITSIPAGRADLDDPMVKDADDDRADAGGRADRGGRAGRGRSARAPGCDHRRAGRDRARVRDRPGRLPLDPRLQGVPQVALHVGERGHLPRHPGRRGRWPTATSSRSTSPPSSAACTATPARTFYAGEPSDEVRLTRRATHEAMMRAIHAVRPGRPVNVIGRVIESYAQAVRIRRGARLHRPRRGPVVPHQADDPALRRAARDDRDRAWHDVHHRADAHARRRTTGTCGTTSGRCSPRTGRGSRSGSTPSPSPTTGRRSSPCQPRRRTPDPGDLSHGRSDPTAGRRLI